MSRMFGRSSVNKIYIDSRFKTKESISDSNFSVDLPESVELGEGTGCVVTDITIPHTWYNISTNNNRFFFRVVREGPPIVIIDVGLTITPQNYDIFQLGQALEETMNAAMAGPVFDVTVDAQAGTLIIALLPANTGVEFLDDDTLATRVNGSWTGPIYDTTNIKSMNSVLRINGLPRQQRVRDNAGPFVTGVIDLLPLHSLFLTSTKISNYSSLSVNGSRNTLKKMVITTGFGQINTYDLVFPEEAVDVSGLTLKLLDFQLRDSFGNIVDLNGAHITFSLLLIKT